MSLTPVQFAAKWRLNRRNERGAYQEHFLDLCRLLGQETPNQDPTGEAYAFEKGAGKQDGGQGFADVWRRNCFAWEYKGKHADLTKAYQQLQQYRESLLNPPLLIASDIERIVIHTNFTNAVKRVYEIGLGEIEQDRWLTPLAESKWARPHATPVAMLRAMFADPESFRPAETIDAVTRDAAIKLGEIAQTLAGYGEEPHATAHFLIRVLFCLFAEDIGLLPRNLFRNVIESSLFQAPVLQAKLRNLFRDMRDGGYYGDERIVHFNGGLFDDENVLQLDGEAMRTLIALSGMDWSSIDPSIFGTLFERSLDPAKRAQLGAHYTDRSDINLIVEPVLMAPLREGWEAAKAQDEPAVRAFHEQLAKTTVLDPACGSGNFLYVSMRALLDLEKTVLAECDQQGWPRPAEPRVSPQNVYGIEINPYAHELAQATVWIGYLQWRNENGYGFPPEPILRKLDNLRNMDAILAPDGSEPAWPAVDVIVGNPPFLGDKKMRAQLGGQYVESLRSLFENRLAGQSDLVCYWFETSREQIELGRVRRVGLLSTNSIRTVSNRKVLERIKETGDIFMAWSDREWILDGAAVRVSILGFDNGSQKDHLLDGVKVTAINADLSASADSTKALPLVENEGICFLGMMKAGPFDIDRQLAAKMLQSGPNPHGKPNSDVVRPRLGGQDVTQLSRATWIVDFGVDMALEEASLYEIPFEHVRANVKPLRDTNRRDRMREKWWIHGEPRPGLRTAIRGLGRCIVTPEVSKHRIFAWMPTTTVPDHKLHVFARDDDYFFGVLHSRVHEVWTLATCAWMGAGNDPSYSSSRTFETFPFPWPPGHEPADDPRVQAIAQAAIELVEKRDRWLQTDDATAAELGAKKKSRAEARTLTNLYNQRPTWLDLAHKTLDAAVFAAYGWPEGLSDQDILARLLELNHERAKST